jgi:hypothetical protein
MTRYIARFVTALASCVLFVCAASADTLEMKDGRILEGRYIGGTQALVRFEINGDIQTFNVTEIVALTFTNHYGGDTAPPDQSTSGNSNGTSSDATPPNDASSQPPAAQSPDSTQTPPAPSRDSGTSVTIPAGYTILVRMIDGVDSSKNQVGDKFHASIERDLLVNGTVVARKGSDVYGQLIEAKEAGKLSGRAELELELTDIVIDGQKYPLVSTDYSVSGQGRGADTAKKVGGGAIIGAIIGAVAGGGRGAAIGAGVGSAAGAGVQVLTKGEKVKVPSETVLDFRLEQPATVVATRK